MRAYSDPATELYRTLNPNWRFEEPAAYLLAEIATIHSDIRFIQAVQLVGDSENVPEEYWPAKYGPRTEQSEPEEPEQGESAADRARRVAAEIRAQLVA